MRAKTVNTGDPGMSLECEGMGKGALVSKTEGVNGRRLEQKGI